nr:VOC family protein [Loktanella fryxellensis]
MPIDYVEFTSPRLEETQAFMTDAFGWSFIDYGPDYRDLQQAGLGGGLERGPLRPPLVILRTEDLEGMLDRVTAAGATITKTIYAFPGGRRFEFTEPGGNGMAVWQPD